MSKLPQLEQEYIVMLEKIRNDFPKEIPKPK